MDPQDPFAQLEELERLRDAGTITAGEFEVKAAQVFDAGDDPDAGPPEPPVQLRRQPWQYVSVLLLDGVLIAWGALSLHGGHAVGGVMVAAGVAFAGWVVWRMISGREVAREPRWRSLLSPVVVLLCWGGLVALHYWDGGSKPAAKPSAEPRPPARVEAASACFTHAGWHVLAGVFLGNDSVPDDPRSFIADASRFSSVLLSVRYYPTGEQARVALPRLQATVRKYRHGRTVRREGRFLYYWALARTVPAAAQETTLACLKV
jgi:hypothetical protein